jgi:hypothetical protein
MIVGQFGNNQAYIFFSAQNGTFQATRPENAENIGDISTATVGGDIYLYHPDEAYMHIHRWHISNLSSIHEWGGSGTLQPNGSVTLVRLF